MSKDSFLRRDDPIFTPFFPSYTPPDSSQAALIAAQSSLDIRDGCTLDEVFDACLNGPRVCSADHLSHLFVIQPRVTSGSVDTCHLVITTPHCTGDGVAVHEVLDQFLSIIGGPGARGGNFRSDAELEEMLLAEWRRKLGASGSIPDCGESKWRGRFQEVASKVEYENYQSSLVVSPIQIGHFTLTRIL